MRPFKQAACFAAALLAPMLGLTAPVAAQDYRHPTELELPEPAFERPAPEALRERLDNGLVAYIAEDHRAPLVSISLLLGLGSGHGEPGAARALTEAFRRGPDGNDTAFHAALEHMNAEFSVSLDHEETELSLDVAAEDFEQALTLLAELVERPAFAGAGAAAGKSSRASSGGIDYNYSLSSAVDRFHRQLFAGHRFAREAGPELNSARQSDSARQLHERLAVPGNMSLAIAGDFARADAVRAAREAFGPLPAKAFSKPEEFAPIETAEPRTLLLENAARDQGWVVVGHELPPVPVEDEAALRVMDYILGAYHLDTRLYLASREMRGLTNDNSSFLEPGVRGPGAYSFRTYGRPEAVRLLLQITFAQLDLMRETQPTDRELFVAKGALVDGLYAQQYATGVAATRSYAREWLRYGNHERSASYPDRVRAVDAADVQAAARRYIDPERAIFTVVGPLDRIARSAAMESEPALDSWGTPPAMD